MTPNVCLWVAAVEPEMIIMDTEDLEAEGFAVHAIDEHLLQVCVTDLNAGRTDGLVAAFEGVL